MRAKNALVGFGILFLSAFAFAQSGEDPIDQLTKPQTQNTGLQQRFAIPCPPQGGYSSFADFFTNCVYNGGDSGVLAKGFRDGDISYSGLTYVPSPQDPFEGKIVFRDYNTALAEIGRVLENGPLVAILNALWLRGVTITDPSSLNSVILTIYVPEPPPPPSSGGSGGGGGGRGDDNSRDNGRPVQLPDPSIDKENQSKTVTYLFGSTGSGGDEWEQATSLVEMVCSLSKRVASLFVVAEPVRVKFYRRSDGVSFAGDVLFMARVNALDRESGAKRIHLIGLRNSQGWKGAYGEPSTGTLVSGFWNMFDRLSNAVSCR
jgi:hypothetical protein